MASAAKPEPKPVVTYPRDAILEMSHLEAVLGVSDETIQKMNLPCFYAGNRVRFVWGQVLDELTARANPNAVPNLAPATKRRRAG